MSDLPEVLAALVINPEDRVIFVWHRDTTREQLDHLGSVIRERWPDLADRTLHVSGVEQLAVVKAASKDSADD